MVSLHAALLVLSLAGAPEGETVLLDFYADWCGPCQQMDPVVQQLAAKGYPVRRVNFDQQRQLAARYGVDRLPTFVMLVNGRVVDREVGATDPGRLEKMCRLAQVNRSAAPVVPATAVASSLDPSLVIPAVNSQPAFSAGQPSVVPVSATSDAAGWRMATQVPEPPAKRGLSDSELLSATVRLRIQDKAGQSCGSGTIIDARKGEALILTCGHLFRDSQGKGQIEVDLFGPSPAEGIPGSLISYNLQHDVALLSIRVSGPVASARVAPPGYKVAANDRVTNVGCNNGANPTVRHSSVTAIDRFSGPANLTVAGLPVQGRSGGGLFSADGYVIGVCNAADPSDNEGLYAALPLIHSELERAKLAHLFRPGEKGSAVEEALVAVAPPMPKQMPPPPDVTQLTEAPLRPRTEASTPRAGTSQELTQEERDALNEIRRRRAEGAEVICVVRSADPNARSEIIVLERATDSFLKQLTLETKRLAESSVAANSATLGTPVFKSPAPPTTLTSTSADDPVPPSRSEGSRERTRLLEWTAPGQ
jgi:thiol-disulfide isomerase/thioredoxin